MMFWLLSLVCGASFLSCEMVGWVDVPCIECLADLAVSESALIPMVNVQSQNMRCEKERM